MRQSFLERFREEVNDANALPPAAPLRAYRFTSAGGAAAEQDESGLPRGCVFKIGFKIGAEYNPYAGKVVVMDEAHHLTRPHRMFQVQLDQLRRYLEKAPNLTLLACTGSMIEGSADDPRALLQSIKGGTGAACDEGFSCKPDMH
jgi:hypothetical protein